MNADYGETVICARLIVIIQKKQKRSDSKKAENNETVMLKPGENVDYKLLEWTTTCKSL